MGKVNLLDCTLRDGGYINEWRFGNEGIRAIISKLELTGIEMIEIGFLKGDSYDPDKTLFPDIDSTKRLLKYKQKKTTYVGMLDMSSPIPFGRITPYDGDSIDAIRVIFKKDRIEQAYKACEIIKAAGYKVFVNFVNTNNYSDKEFIEGLELFSDVKPDGITIVDTFGMIKRKHFERLVAIADNNLPPQIMLGYHAHNNLQQAFGNAEMMVEMNLKRDIVIDACVFGMGRGAGNLNLELFAEYLNDNYGKSYRITPILEIMDEYLNQFYKTSFWGYSLPLYLSATHGCHPNYAVYLAEKNTLSEKAFDELLRGISDDDKLVFSKSKADDYYQKYMECYVDDDNAISTLGADLEGKEVLVLAPGKTISDYQQEILKMMNRGVIVISINFYDSDFSPNYVFTSNIRRFGKIMCSPHKAKIIVTSNVPNNMEADYIVNYSSFTGANGTAFDNSGLMLLRLLERVRVSEVYIAGMDGYSNNGKDDYYESGFETYHTTKMNGMNELISIELREIQKRLKISFITPSRYALQ